MEDKIMMGKLQNVEPKLFYHSIQLGSRIPQGYPLRKIKQLVDFSFIRTRVEHLYGKNGNISVDPAVILKLIFLLFYENVKSERALMEHLPLRLDWLWFCGYDLDDQTPDHSVISKARRRWGPDVFAEFFAAILRQCIDAGLVDGQTIHIDSSMISANASKDTIKPQLKLLGQKLYSQLDEQTQSEKDSNNLEELDDNKDGENDEQSDGFKRCCISDTDPDARLSKKYGQHILGYKDHRVIDDQCGIITASITTAANVTDDKLLKEAVETHCANTDIDPRTAVADKAYGTIDNYMYLHSHDITPCISHKVYRSKDKELFSREQFVYDRQLDRYICPANQILKRRQLDRWNQGVRYCIDRSVCEKCQYRKECINSEKSGRSIRRKFGTEYMEWADTCLSKRQRRCLTKRRKTKLEGSFADAVNNHGFKRARWRGSIKMQMQNLMIAAIQNLRKLLHHLGNGGLPAVKQAQDIAMFDIIALITYFTHRLQQDFRRYTSKYPLFKERCRLAF